MASRERSSSGSKGRPRAPAKTPYEREMQLIDAAVDLSERRILDGSASSQEVVHWLKLGSSRERLEQQRLKNEVQLLETKNEHMQSEMRTEALIRDALQAMRSYSGVEESPEEEPGDAEQDSDVY